jgi:hypothetical protein
MWARHECVGNGALVDSVGCPSGNVVGRCVWGPETIVLRRLTPAIQECLSFRQSLMTWWSNLSRYVGGNCHVGAVDVWEWGSA